MRCDNDAQALEEREARQHVQEPEILQQQVLREGNRTDRPNEANNSEKSAASGANGGVRELREQPAVRAASCGLQQASGRSDFMQSVSLSIPCVWRPEPDLGRVAKGVPNRVQKLKALGNAVVPQVVEMIGRAILEAT